MNYIEELEKYKPINEQEKSDKKFMQDLIQQYGDQVLARELKFAHFSASSLILNEALDKVLMCYHNIYKSWSWTGGHADNCSDLLEVAKKEAMEETGLNKLKLFRSELYAIDNLPVWGHIKNGTFISSHIHCNFTYLFIGDENEKLQHKADENSAVKWIKIADLEEEVEEKQMLEVYKKLLRAI